MERMSKVVLILTTILVVAAMDVEGGRRIKSNENREEGTVDQPQNFLGGAGGILPGSPGFTGVVFGPSGFCPYPGGCVPAVPVLPTLPGVPFAGGSPPVTPTGVPYTP